MKIASSAGILLAALLAAAAGNAQDNHPRRGGTPTRQHEAALEAVIDRQCHSVMELLYRNRLSEAKEVADSLLAAAPEDPRSHLLMARVLRESFPDQNSTGDHLEALSAPIQAESDLAIAMADRLVNADERSVAGYLYRGWAHLFRSQMHTFCNEYWSAGRQAKAGKNDLDRALELDPDNIDAQGVLGSYLYFADVLPRVVKLARTIVRVPGGDRGRGLELMYHASRGNGYVRLDARALIAVIEFAFEGDFEAATRDFDAFLLEYPNNPRLMEPLAVMHPLHPEDGYAERIAAAATEHMNSTDTWNRQLAQRLFFYHAIGDLVSGSVDDAAVRLETLRRSAPAYPDWFERTVMLCTAETELLRGDREAAIAVYATVSQPPDAEDPPWVVDTQRRLEERLRFVKTPEAAAPDSEVAALRRLERVARALYAGDFATAEQELAAIPAGSSPGVVYYQGELARLTHRDNDALAAFDRFTAAQLPDRWRFFKCFAFVHIAEIQAAHGDRHAAAHSIERLIDFDRDGDLIRHALRARKEFFEREGPPLRPADNNVPPVQTAR